MALVICIGESFAYVWSGSYGSIEDLGVGNAILIMM